MQGEQTRRAIIVGASSGIGAALAERLAHEGFDLALVARRDDRLAEVADAIKATIERAVVRTIAHDVRRVEEVPELFARLVEELHGLDLIVYAAGAMAPLGPDEYDTETDRELVETNLLGAIAWLNEAAGWLGVAGRGSLVGVSSLAGERGRRGNPAYGAAKAGLTAYLEALRNRLAPHGVHVLTVKPGYVRTRMLEGQSRLFWVSSPEQAAERIWTGIRRRRQTIFVAPRWRLVAWVVRAIPSWLFRRLPI